MSTETISRRRFLGFLGIAAVTYAIPAALPDAAVAQQVPSPPTAPPAGGTERRVERRTGRTERRQDRRTRRAERRALRRDGRAERRSIRREGRAVRQEIRQGP